MSDNEDELDEDDSDAPGDSNGTCTRTTAGAGVVDERRRSSFLGLDRLGLCERVERVLAGCC